MKLHHFVTAPSERDLQVQNIGKALVVKSIVEAAPKPAPLILKDLVSDMDGDGVFF